MILKLNTQSNFSNKNENLIFYDTECTGLNIFHDQCIQFASVLTDNNFQQISDLNLDIKLLSYIIPNPKALKVNHININSLFSNDRILDYEAAIQILNFMKNKNKSNIFLSFNGSKFDDLLLRVKMYKNLQDPYFMTRNNSKRMDILKLLHVANYVNPNIIKIPKDINGNNSFKLENISRHNGIDINAHDALGDTLALVELTKNLKENFETIWNILLENGNSTESENNMKKFFMTHNFSKPIWLYNHFSEEKVKPYLPLATDSKKCWILLDLSSDITNLNISDFEKFLIDKTNSPFKIIRTSNCPIIIKEKYLDLFKQNNITTSSIQDNQNFYKNLSIEIYKVLKNTSIFKENENKTNEEKIYDGFYNRDDEFKIKQFNEQIYYEDKSKIKFSDNRLKDFSSRILIEAQKSKKCYFDENQLEQLNKNCPNVYQRPYENSDKWNNIYTSNVDENNNIILPEWDDWCSRNFPKEVQFKLF